MIIATSTASVYAVASIFLSIVIFSAYMMIFGIIMVCILWPIAKFMNVIYRFINY